MGKTKSIIIAIISLVAFSTNLEKLENSGMRLLALLYATDKFGGKCTTEIRLRTTSYSADINRAKNKTDAAHKEGMANVFTFKLIPLPIIGNLS